MNEFLSKSEVIYKKTFPGFIPLLLDGPEESDADSYPTTEEVEQSLAAKYRYVEIPGRKETARRFIERAVEVSEFNELDIEIRRASTHIAVRFWLHDVNLFDDMPRLIGMADEMSLSTENDSRRLTLLLYCYTHALYQNDRRLYPLLDGS